MLKIKITHDEKETYIPYLLTLYENDTVIYTSHHKTEADLKEEITSISVLAREIIIER